MATEYHQQTLSGVRFEKGHYTTKEVSEIYHVSQASVCAWCRKGWLKADREKTIGSSGRGGRWKVMPDQLEQVEARKEELIELSRHYWIRLFVKLQKH
jgi:hypothetical protein